MSENVRLTAKQNRAIVALISEPGLAAAAHTAGVDERTLRRWLEEADFKQALNAAEVSAIDQAARRLAGASEQAIALLLEVMNDKANAPGIRIRAALGILDALLKLRELRIEQRLAALEMAAKTGQSNHVFNHDAVVRSIASRSVTERSVGDDAD